MEQGEIKRDFQIEDAEADAMAELIKTRAAKSEGLGSVPGTH